MNNCENCGGNLKFDAIKKVLKCEKCKSETPVDVQTGYTGHSFDMNGVTEEKIKTNKTAKCSNCGAVISSETYTLSDTCDYCGAHLVEQLELGVSPDGCLLYTFDKEDAKSKFKEGLKNKWFLPNKFKREPNLDSIESVYIPAYLYDVTTENQYNGEIYESDTDRSNNTKRYYKKIRGSLTMREDDILLECSNQINQLTLDNISPYDLSQMVKFKPEFLLGYSVEYYEKNLQETKNILKQVIYNRVKRNILKGYSYDGVNYLNINTEYSDCKYSRIILPAYRVKYRYGKKEYATYLNGQTGKVGGNLPKSKVKIGFFVLGIIAIIGLVVAGFIL